MKLLLLLQLCILGRAVSHEVAGEEEKKVSNFRELVNRFLPGDSHNPVRLKPSFRPWSPMNVL